MKSSYTRGGGLHYTQLIFENAKSFIFGDRLRYTEVIIFRKG